MTLREAQSIFIRNAAKLILWAFENGYELTGGELQRTIEQQRIYYNEGLSKTLNGYHLKKLAIDLNLFIQGVFQRNKEAYKPLAEYWKSLHPNNVAGYDWGWDPFHFEMKLYAVRTREKIYMKRIKSISTPKISNNKF